MLPESRAEAHAHWKRLLVGVLAQVQREVAELLRACTREGATTAATGRALAYAAGRFARAPLTPPRTFEAARDAAIDLLDARPASAAWSATRASRVARRSGCAAVTAACRCRSSNRRRSMTAIRRRRPSSAPRPTSIPWTSSAACARGPAGRSNLERYVDGDAVFLSRKSHDGRELIALERPGLWNGAMAGWNTLCVEVPGSTFAPVKTVLDLLRPEHQ